MFSSGMKEGSSSDEILIEDYSYDVFSSLVEYCYTGEVQLHPENIVELCIWYIFLILFFWIWRPINIVWEI